MEQQRGKKTARSVGNLPSREASAVLSSASLCSRTSLVQEAWVADEETYCIPRWDTLDPRTNLRASPKMEEHAADRFASNSHPSRRPAKGNRSSRSQIGEPARGVSTH